MKRKKGDFLKYIIFLLGLVTVSLLVFTAVRDNNDAYCLSIPKSSVVFSPFEIDGNAELDTWAITNSPDTDGLSWTTAHVIEDYEIDASSATYGIRIMNTNKCLIIRNCEVSMASRDGIALMMCENVKIMDCNLYDNEQCGLRLASSSDLVVSDNVARRNTFGFNSQGSNHCNITKNIAENNNIDGFDFLGSNNMNVIGNTAKNSECGIYLANSDSNTISDNKISSMTSNGIYLRADCDNNEVFNNRMCDNEPENVVDLGTNNNIYDNTCSSAGIPGYNLIGLIGFAVISIVGTSIIISVKKKNYK